MANRFIGLPSARYIGVKCPSCRHEFKIDNGKEYDRHEYLSFPRKDRGTCPLCLNEYAIDTTISIFGVVLN